MILLSDAMVLMDMGHVGGLEILGKIAPTEVLDVVLQECEHESQPGLVQAIKKAGIKEIPSSVALVQEASKYSSLYDQLSLQDSLCLHYAKQNKKTLLTNEKHLRNRCLVESVDVHGTIWILEQFHNGGFKKPKELCGWIALLSKKERRLPKEEVARLKILFECT
ncbi:MAG: hypothetical protein SFY67_10260 [Candidatus Melainabacteria bacterium]|nr:hypothetical protein [Candidatus Melainabacteria bacterium]